MNRESLFPSVAGGREATHKWVNDRNLDHPYVHGLIDDLYDLVAAGDALAEILRDEAESRDVEDDRTVDALDKWGECRDR